MAALHGRAPKGACAAALRSFTGPLRLFTLSFSAFLLAYFFILRRVLFPRAAAVDPSLAPYRHLASVHSGAAGAPPARPLPAAWYLAPAAASTSDALHGGAAAAAAAPAAAAAAAAAPAPPQPSFWHSLPLRPAAQPQLVTFVCEIPHGGTAKYEVQTALPGTPIAQDGAASGGAPRHYAWRALLNYGMLPQTLEDAQGPRALSGLPGDGDPLDALDMWPAPCAPGEAYAARVVGALGMLDGGATDWKVLVVRHHGGLPAALLEDVAELAPALESLAGDAEAAAAAEAAGGGAGGAGAPPPHPVLTLLAGGGGAAPGSAAAVSAAPAPAAQPAGSRLQARVAAELPPAALAGALAGALAAMPRSEDGEWGGCAGGAGGRVTFAAPRGSGGGPGARHATHPPALLAALSRVGAGGGVGEEEAAVLRGSVRVWAATRLAHVREWLAGYKAAAAAAAAAAAGGGGGSAPRAEFLWGGALLDARSAQAVVEQAHADYAAAKREGRVGL